MLLHPAGIQSKYPIDSSVLHKRYECAFHILQAGVVSVQDDVDRSKVLIGVAVILVCNEVNLIGRGETVSCCHEA